jgi:hypothetical protein
MEIPMMELPEALTLATQINKTIRGKRIAGVTTVSDRRRTPGLQMALAPKPAPSRTRHGVARLAFLCFRSL